MHNGCSLKLTDIILNQINKQYTLGNKLSNRKEQSPGLRHRGFTLKFKNWRGEEVTERNPGKKQSLNRKIFRKCDVKKRLKGESWNQEFQVLQLNQ